MDTHIMGTGLQLTDEVRAYIAKQAQKIEKLVHHNSDAARLSVELEQLSEHQTSDGFRAELLLSGPGLSLRAEARGSTLHSSIDEVVEKMMVELRKVKGKRMDRVRRQAGKMKDFLRGFGGFR